MTLISFGVMNLFTSIKAEDILHPTPDDETN